MKNKLVVTKYEDRVVSFLIDDNGKTLKIECDNPDKKTIVGNIYACNVTNVRNDLNAAFVNCGNFTGFLKLKGEVTFLNNRAPGPIRQGDIVAGEVITDAHMSKCPVLKPVSISKSVSKAGVICEIPPMYIKLGNEAEEIVTDYTDIFAELKKAYPEKIDNIRFHVGRDISLGTVFALERRLDEATSRKVNLKSGAFIMIEPTEALVSIDINTGKSDDGRSGEKEFMKVNKEAAVEIARQIRLRNLSGIIIVDFINVDDKSELYRFMRECLQNDPLKPVLVDITKLGLAEITRKKERRPLYELIDF